MLEFKRRYLDPNATELQVAGLAWVRRRNPALTTTRWHPSSRLIEGGIAEGWLSMGSGQVLITADNGTAAFRIVSPPGHYCCHCGLKLGDSEHGARHVAEAHAVAPSPDPNNPSGWRRDSHYTCELVSLPPPPPATLGKDGKPLPEASHKRPERHVPVAGRSHVRA